MSAPAADIEYDTTRNAMSVYQGWIPQRIVNEALTGVLLDYVRHLRKRVVSLSSVWFRQLHMSDIPANCVKHKYVMPSVCSQQSAVICVTVMHCIELTCVRRKQSAMYNFVVCTSDIPTIAT